MSTQHPDCATMPKWTNGEMFSNGDEIKEVLHAFKLGCDEQLWDWEGKDVDPHVIRKLLLLDKKFFEKSILGKDAFITYRIPNPDVERTERKAVVEALESIARNADVAKDFYGKDQIPIFEVALPMTTSHLQLLRVSSFYEKIVVGKEDIFIHPHIEKFSIKNWIGKVMPEEINIIPLVEDAHSIFRIREILSNYIKFKKPKYMRPWLARSDTALNYGLASAVLLIKFAISEICRIEKETGVKQCPIIGVGSLPFRGHLSPSNIDNFLEEYSGFQTFTFQSALKYDFEKRQIEKTVKKIKERKMKKRTISREESEQIKKIIEIFSKNYRENITLMADAINSISKHIPSRRMRKMHIGLFGYSRQFSKGIHLPRAINFTGSLYSIGIPPEILGMRSLTEIEKAGLFETLSKNYVNIKEDLRFALSYFSPRNMEKLQKTLLSKKSVSLIKRDVESIREIYGIDAEKQKKHEDVTKKIISSLGKGQATKYIVEAAKIRKSLG